MREFSTPPAKPLLRGVSHQAAFVMALGAGAFLVTHAATVQAMGAAWVYALCMAAMFGISALYHRRTWGERGRQRMRRLDHAGIFLMIAGSYTPVAALALPPSSGSPLLGVMWALTAAAVLQKLFWPHAPKPVSVGLYLAIGWVGLPFLPQIAAAMGPTALALIVAGGVLYSGGALIYALRRPDPFPRIFGYHEVFHALVIVASVLHFAAIAPLIA
ncbi:hemolysin-III related [compost metagenome]